MVDRRGFFGRMAGVAAALGIKLPDENPAPVWSEPITSTIEETVVAKQAQIPNASITAMDVRKLIDRIGTKPIRETYDVRVSLYCNQLLEYIEDPEALFTIWCIEEGTGAQLSVPVTGGIGTEYPELEPGQMLTIYPDMMLVECDRMLSADEFTMLELHFTGYTQPIRMVG